MEEIDSQNTAVLLVDGKVQNPICNGDICVWEAEEDILYIHLLEKGVTERIDIRPQHIFSYGLIGNYVIVNCKGDAGAYCYDVKIKSMRVWILLQRFSICILSKDRRTMYR